MKNRIMSLGNQRIFKLIFLLAVFTIAFACSSKKAIEFCEGVSTEGKGVNCGTVFTPGELTAIIQTESSFTVNKLNAIIFKKEKYKSKKIESLSIEVKPDATSAKINFYLYDEGDFLVEVTGKDNQKIAEGGITIIEEY